MDQLPISLPMLVAAATVLVLVGALLFVRKVPLAYNLRNLVVRWRTTLLTALAFTFVVALLTFMLAFVTGMSNLTRNSGRPENVLVMSEGATDEAFSNLAYSDTSDLDNLLDKANRQRLARNDNLPRRGNAARLSAGERSARRRLAGGARRSWRGPGRLHRGGRGGRSRRLTRPIGRARSRAPSPRAGSGDGS